MIIYNHLLVETKKYCVLSEKIFVIEAKSLLVTIAQREKELLLTTNYDNKIPELKNVLYCLKIYYNFNV